MPSGYHSAKKNGIRSEDYRSILAVGADPSHGHRMEETTSGNHAADPAQYDSPYEDRVAALARKRFGIPYVYPWQRLVIANILDAAQASRDEERTDEDGALRGQQIVLLPTGAGKSLCFQLPALILPGLTVVVYPLLALMGDQLRRLSESRIPTVIFRGGQDGRERNAAFARLEGTDGKEPARLAIVNPEILANRQIIDRIAGLGVSHMAIDEAHCVSEWGDSFRPAYLECGRYVERIKPLACTAFTATASPPVLTRVADVLFGGKAHLVRGESDRPNIRYRVIPCISKEAEIVRQVCEATRPAVVFCATRGGAEKTALLIREILGDPHVRFYHAALTRAEKDRVEAWFHGHDGAVLTTTCAWGMGVDKKNVRTVIHRDPPPTAEAYIQEAGRGGRDGLNAQAILLWSTEDKRKIEAKVPAERDRSRVLARFAESGECRREVLLEALGDPKAGAGAGGERMVCSGCDVCDGDAITMPDESWLMSDFIARNDGRYGAGQAASLLAEAGNAASTDGRGTFLWRTQDFVEAADELVRTGRLRVTRRWPARGRLSVGKKG